MPTSFAQAPNNVSAKVGPSGYAAGASTLTLAAGDGAKFPALAGSQWLRVTLVRAAVAYSPVASASADLTIRKVTAISGDVLTLAAGTLEGTTDRNYAAGDVVECRLTGGALSDVHGAVNAIESDATIVRTSSSYANPTWITSLDVAKVTGAEKTANKGVANGYASLGSDGLVPASQLPATASGALERPTGSNLVLWLKSSGNQTSAPINLGSALFAKASSQYLSAPDSASLRAQPSFYLSGWFLFNSLSAQMFLMGKGTAAVAAAQCEYVVYYQPAIPSLQFYLSDGTNLVGVGTTTFTAVTGTRYFVEVWADATAQTANVQVNGANLASTAWTHTVQQGTNPFSVGRDFSNGAAYFDGQANSVLLLNRVPTSAERTWLYNGGAGRQAAELGIPGNSGSNLLFGPNSGDAWDMTDRTATRVAGFNGNNLQPPSTLTQIPTFSTSGLFSSAGKIQPVTTAVDESGKGNNYYPGAVAPVVAADAINGKASLRFGGFGSYLSGNQVIDTDRGFTVHAILKAANTSFDTMTLLRIRTNALAGSDLILAVGKSGNAGLAGASPYFGYTANGANRAVATGGFTGNLLKTSLLTVTFKGGNKADSLNYRCYLNGTPLTVGVATYAFAGTVPASLVGASDATPSFTVEGHMPEVLVYDHGMSLVDAIPLWNDRRASSEYGITGWASSDPTDSFTNNTPATNQQSAGWTWDATRPQIVCHGNSMTLGLYTTESPTGSNLYPSSYPNQLVGLLGSGWDMTNLGVGGQTTEGLLNTQETALSYWWYRRSKNILIVFEGVNSLTTGTAQRDTPEQAYGAMSKYVANAKVNGFKVILVGAPAAGGPMVTDASYAANKATYNAMVAANTAGADLTIDPTSDARLANPANTTYITDGLHYSAAGYGVLAGLLKPLVLSL